MTFLRRRPPPVAALAVAAGLTALSAQAHAQGGVPVIRDAEIEQLLRDYTQPLLRAAGLAKQNVRVVIINDPSFNAFVIDGQRIFVNGGALMEAKTPNEIIGVLAHETGHIAGGHLSRLRSELERAQTTAILAMLLGGAAMVAGSRVQGAGDIGLAAITAPQEIIRRTLLSYIRSQEDQADRAAVRFLTATGQSAKGMHDLFKRMSDQMLFASRLIDPYVQSHPMPSERVAALEGLAKTSPHWNKTDSAALQLRHDMMRAKLSGFLESADTIARRYPASNTSLPARYARAISAYRHAGLRAALSQIDALIQSQPANAYLHELKGQALLESGQAAAAIAPLRRAAQLASNPDLIQVLLAKAMISANDKQALPEAIAILRRAVMREPELPEGYTQLAMAYGKQGDLAEADLASAQAAYRRGDIKTARELAARAKLRFKVGTPGWVKADDLVGVKPPSVNLN
jgi:predicted Zn-dependent protease